MRAAPWLAAAIVVAAVALVFGVPFNSGAGLLIITLWLVGCIRLASASTGRPQR